MLGDYFTLGFKNLRRRGIRSWLTLLGIFIGIVAVVSLITLGAGLKAAVNSQFGISSTEVITVQAGGLNAYGPPGSGAVTPLTIDDVEAIEKLDTVERTIRRNIPPGKLEFNDIIGFGISMSIPDGDDRQFVYDMLEIEAEVGRLLKDGDTNKVILGYSFYSEDNAYDKLIRPGHNVLINDEEFEVIGILKKKGSLLLDGSVYINDRPLEELIGYGDDVDLIVVKVKNKDLMDKAKEDIEKLLRQRRDVKVGEEDFEVSTPEAALETVNNVLNGIQAFILIIAFISILVGAIGIINTMTTSVLERKKEIGIMKSIGARNSDIFLQFFIEAGLMGLIGGVLGIIVGLIIGWFGTNAINSFLGSSTSPVISLTLILGTLLGSFLIGSISGILPAMKAAKQNPVEALRD